MLSERLSKFGAKGFAAVNGSDSIAAMEFGSFNCPSGGGVGSWWRKDVKIWELWI